MYLVFLLRHSTTAMHTGLFLTHTSLHPCESQCGIWIMDSETRLIMEFSLDPELSAALVLSKPFYL